METAAETTVLFFNLHAGEVNPIISRLKNPEPNSLTEITSVPWNVVENSSDLAVSDALACSSGDTAATTIRLIRKTVPILKAAYDQVDQQTKLDSTLFGALKVLQEFGTRYRKPKIVEQVKTGLEILLENREEHSTLAKMLKLPSKLNSAPGRRRHRKRDNRPLLDARIPFMCLTNTPSAAPCVQPETPDSDEWTNYVQLLQREATPTVTGVTLFGETLSQDVSPETSRTAWMHSIPSPSFTSFSVDES